MPKAKNVTVIPATLNIHTKTPTTERVRRRVAAYARVSTDSEEPRVSVKLDLKNDAQLTSDQVEGIYALVLNSLPGLERENISILDSDGKLLSG